MRFEAFALWKLVLASVWNNEWLIVLSSGAQWRGEEETVWYVRLCRVWRGSGRRGTSAVLERREQHQPRGAFPQDLWRVFLELEALGISTPSSISHKRSEVVSSGDSQGILIELWKQAVRLEHAVDICVQYTPDNKGSMKSVTPNV